MIQLKDPTLVATIDIGAHSVRMLIAEVKPDMSFDVLEFLEQRIPLGSYVFKNGRIGNKDILLLCDIFRNFRQKIDEYGIKLYKAIATSAVREAENAEIFLERIYNASGIKVSIFEGTDGARLDFLTVQRDIPEKYGFSHKRILIAEIGTGACQISLYENGNILFTETIRIGTLRILEAMPSTISFSGIAQSLSPLVAKAFSELSHVAANLRVDGIIAMGSSVRALTNFARELKPQQRSVRIMHSRFLEIYKGLTENKVEKIVEAGKISYDLAEAVVPCCLILDYLFNLTEAKDLVVPVSSTKDALLLDFICEKMMKDDYFAHQVLSIVRNIASKYKCQNDYTERSVQVSETFFNALTELHGLGTKELLYLKLAAYLHKSGLFINNQAYHKHSYYLISSSDIPGISREEKQIVALIARYHRKSFPKPAHIEYISIPQADRAVVNKLAAILRLACALAELNITPKNLSIRVKDEDSIEVKVTGTDVMIETSFLELDAEFFYYVFAKKIIFLT